jgi:hypothetical protein
MDRLAAKLRQTAESRVGHSKGGTARPPTTKQSDRRQTRAILIIIACLVGSIPLTIAIGAWVLHLTEERRSDALRRTLEPRLPLERAAESIERARPSFARLVERATLSDVVERLARSLPAEAKVHAMGRDQAGILTIEIDTADPDLLRPAIERDPVLRDLDEVGQTRSGDHGLRVTLRG